jgi:uncharacterized protein YvpB
VRSFVLVLLIAAVAGVADAHGSVASTSVGKNRRFADAVTKGKPGPVPLVQQAYRNNCETASLSMLLASAGVRVDQRVLQRLLPRSGPLDPVVGDDGVWTWGSPDEGFVGRALGGGTAGGFGVYQGPVRRLAARYGVVAADLSRTSLTTIVTRLRQGRPVMAWIALSDGPYRRWRTPNGRLISVNMGEHAVVLTGVRAGRILVNDPLTGSRLQWTIDEFSNRWRLLGYRALGL